MKSDSLKKEVAFYQKHVSQWLPFYRGKFALIRNEDLIGAYNTEKEAYVEGIRRFGIEPFLIKRIADEESTEDVPAYLIDRIAS